jgi:hypothetical protein
MMPTSLDASIAWDPLLVDGVEDPVDRSEVLRYLGYPAGRIPSRAVEDEVDEWIDQGARLAVPRATCLVFPVMAKDRRTLCLGTGSCTTVFRGAIGEFLEPAKLVGVFIATAGNALEARASELVRGGDLLPGMVLNAVGAERAEAAEAEVIARLASLVAPLGLAPTLPYSPGYCGMELTEQIPLFARFEGIQVGVTLTADCLMRPLKSVSGLVGLGPVDQVRAAGSPCERCDLHRCAMRR